MNIIYCSYCESEATRVCKHPDCDSEPFFCSGPCNKGVSSKVHTHSGKQDFSLIS